MTINFENYGKFLITLRYDDNTYDNYEGCGEGYTLKEAADFISQNIENSLSIVSADIVDAETGEVVAIIEAEDEDHSEEWYDWRDEEWREDPFMEYSYDPYMGCYSEDC